VSLADLPQANRDPELAVGQIALVGVRHYRRVAQRGGLHRVLVAEVGADQQSGGGRQVAASGEAVADQVVVVPEGCFEVVMAVTEAL
jgi:hypothetical protein